jgi:chromosome segregation protein
MASRGGPERWRGMVADLIEVDVAHADIIEAALGSAEKLLIANHQADILALARELDSKLPGQVRFLALDAIESGSFGAQTSPVIPSERSESRNLAGVEGVVPPPSDAAGDVSLAIQTPLPPESLGSAAELAAAMESVAAPEPAVVIEPAAEAAVDSPRLSDYPQAIGWAMDVVQTAADVRPAIAHLLARTIIVRTLEDAVDLARGPWRGYRFVTQSGSLLEADGSVSVGPPGAETSLISRRSQLRDILREREALGHRIEELQASRLRAVDELNALDTVQQKLRQEIYEGSMRKVEVEGQLRRVAETRGSLEAETPVIEAELAQFAAQRSQTTAERDRLRQEIADLQRHEAEHIGSIAAMAVQQEELGHARDACEEERTESRILLAQLREKHAALVDQVAAAVRDLASTRDGIEQAGADLGQCLQRISESERSMLRLQSELATLFLDKESAEAQVRLLAEQRAERRAAVAELSEKARVVEGELDELQQQIHALELQGRELQTKRDDLVQRVRDDFAIDLAERHAGWQPEQVNWEAVAEEIRELQGKIERLGAVNLEAIDEQETLEQRTTLLRQQRDDLTKAREALGNLIERINRESRERFLKTFNAVRTNFQDLFRKLFAGGKADVFLENEEDVLESGIEVVARPPGKQLQRISLLSGGEKTMTAVALLLAIFRARPSPFAILDEVDAALDESNVGRFTDMVKEFLDQSQFVIISHNKRTMAIGNVIYGVTMGEPGVSRKVSVKFSDLHEQGYELGAPIQDVKTETDAAEPGAAQEPAWSTDDESDADAAPAAGAEPVVASQPAADLSDEALAKSEEPGDVAAEVESMPIETQAALSAAGARAAHDASPATEEATEPSDLPADSSTAPEDASVVDAETIK